MNTNNHTKHTYIIQCFAIKSSVEHCPLSSRYLERFFNDKMTIVVNTYFDHITHQLFSYQNSRLYQNLRFIILVNFCMNLLISRSKLISGVLISLDVIRFAHDTKKNCNCAKSYQVVIVQLAVVMFLKYVRDTMFLSLCG